MPSNFIDGVTEQKIFDTISANKQENALYRTNASPQVAQAAAQIYRNSPWLTPGQVLTLAKGGASPQAIQLASEIQAKIAPEKVDTTRQRQKSWWERNVFDKAKAVSRWSFATLNLAPEIAQNVASQIASPNDPDGWDGFFKSTSLGTMFQDSGLAGEGWFMGGKAMEKQAERARRFRGTVGDSAWTIGRGAADVFFTPGSKEYSILSGVLDAVVNIGADPTIVGGKALAGARAGRATIAGIQTAEEISAAKKIALVADKALAGLTQAEKVAWDTSKFTRFMTSDARAKRLLDIVAGEEDPVRMFRDVFDGKIDLTTAKKLADAKTTDQILGILGEQTAVLDQVSARALPTDIRDIRGSQLFYKERTPLVNTWRQSRALTEMPDNFILHGNSFDKMKALKNYNNYLNTIKSGYTETDDGRKLMRTMFDALNDDTKTGLDMARDAFDATVKTLLDEDGVPEVISKDLFAKVRESIDETRAYFVDEAGDPTDAGFVQALIQSGKIDPAVFGNLTPQSLKALRLHGPGSVVELLDRTHVLPDIRTLRRVTANPILKKMISRADADPRAAIALAEYVQNKVWKPLTLATGGYIMRNMFDAQVRIATIGKDGFFNHPLRYIQWVIGDKGAERIIGRNFDEGIRGLTDQFDEVTDYYAESQQISLGRGLDDVVPAVRRSSRKDFDIISRKKDGAELWARGLVDELIQISKDTLENAVAKGIPTDELVDYLKNNPKGREALAQIEKYLDNGINIIGDGDYSIKVPVRGIDDDVLRQWIDHLAKGRVNLKTGGDADLAFAVGYKRVPLNETFTEFANNIQPSQFVDGPVNRGRGTLIDLGKDANGERIQAVVTDVYQTTNGDRWLMRRVSNNRFTGKATSQAEAEEFARGRAELTRLVNEKRMSANLPDKVKLAKRYATPDKSSPASRALDRMTNLFFHELYEKRFVNKLERSPVYRQFYYERVAENVDSLTPTEAKDLLASIKTRAAAIEMKPSDYVGGKANWKKIQELAAQANGTGTIRDLDDYAGLMALQSTKDALFNATSRNNLEDALRIVVPFGAAWREVLGTYARLVAEDPTRIRRTQQVFNGLANADPDADGNGFFYRDPVSGEYSFNFPMSGEISKLITKLGGGPGLEVPLQAPVKRLSIGLSVIPAIGPVAQIPVGMLPDTPTFDGIISILLPYGRTTAGKLGLPSWAQKAKSALMDNPNKMDTILGNTYADTLRALAASGDYNMDDPQQRQQLLEDAKGKARILTAMRALGQFIGPAAPSNEFVIDSKDGDIYASQLIKEFYRLQNENYDTAVSEFLRIYGDDAMLYLSSKSKATVGGLEATKEFGDWERTNAGLIEQFPDVAAYFAPGGSDFDFTTWERQVRTGKRERLSGKQIVEQAEYRIGSAQYRAYRSQIGPYPNEEQRAWLRNVRVELNRKYPGFPAVPVFTVGEFDQKVAQMAQAVQDPRLQGNPTAKAVSDYLTYRDQAIAQYVAAGGSAQGFASAKAAEPLRDWLANIGTTLAAKTPDFSRVWERELQSEVDQ
jgi:hypothetical protein